MVVGFLGSLFGNLIKAAVSRQREFLADASAVQFTRNPEGIAGALKRIGAAVFGSKLIGPRAAEASHMYFAEGVASLFATHPPLNIRIRAIDPDWDGKFPPPLPTDAVAGVEAVGAEGFIEGVSCVPRPLMFTTSLFRCRRSSMRPGRSRVPRKSIARTFNNCWQRCRNC